MKAAKYFESIDTTDASGNAIVVQQLNLAKLQAEYPSLTSANAAMNESEIEELILAAEEKAAYKAAHGGKIAVTNASGAEVQYTYAKKGAKRPLSRSKAEERLIGRVERLIPQQGGNGVTVHFTTFMERANGEIVEHKAQRFLTEKAKAVFQAEVGDVIAMINQRTIGGVTGFLATQIDETAIPTDAETGEITVNNALSKGVWVFHAEDSNSYIWNRCSPAEKVEAVKLIETFATQTEHRRKLLLQSKEAELKETKIDGMFRAVTKMNQIDGLDSKDRLALALALIEKA